MKVRFFTALMLLGFTLTSYCANSDSTRTSFQLGVLCGLSQNHSISGNLNLGLLIPIQTQTIEINLGYSFFSNETDYQGTSGIDFNSHGLFVEGNFHFNKTFYAGLQMAYNLNWVGEQSQAQFEKMSSYQSPTFFTGKSFYSQIGFVKPLSDRLTLKAQGQLGIHNYKIDEGQFWEISNSDDSWRQAQFGIETKLQLLYNLSIGVSYRLK